MPNFSLRSSGPAIRAATTGVVEYTTTTGTGPYQLLGAAPGFATFLARVDHRKPVRYRVTNNVTQEIGMGLFDAESNQLIRVHMLLKPFVLVDWPEGRKLVYVMQVQPE